MSLENFRRCARRICNSPVINGGVRDHADGVAIDPLPEDDVCVTDMRLDFLLGLDIEDLKRTASLGGIEMTM